MNIACFVSSQISSHSSFSIQDLFKLLYQASFGREHILTEKVAEYLVKEYEEVEALDIPLIEKISEHYIRVNLASWKYNKLDLQWLKRLFFVDNIIEIDGNKLFFEYLEEIEESISSGALNLSKKAFEEFKLEYLTKGLHPIHHSENYRQNEYPHYRLMPSCFSKAIDILVMLSRSNKRSGTIVIDGRAASGKSTIAGLVSKVLDAPIIHMDDFFLPPEKRTAERLSEAGGNVDYERFSKEVVNSLGIGDFEYGIFDCSEMKITGKKLIEKSEYLIVEGSYSHHPHFGEYGDLRVFSDIDETEQRKRILNRNGQSMLEMFEKRWIPMEEKYFAAFGIKEKSDLII